MKKYKTNQRRYSMLKTTISKDLQFIDSRHKDAVESNLKKSSQTYHLEDDIDFKQIVSIYQKITQINQKDPFYKFKQKSNTVDVNRKQKFISRLGEKERKYSKLVNNYIENMGESQGTSLNELSIEKINILKKLLERYNIKFLEKNNYEKLINTFGLKIQSFKSQEIIHQIKNNIIYDKPHTAFLDRNKKIIPYEPLPQESLIMRYRRLTSEIKDLQSKPVLHTDKLSNNTLYKWMDRKSQIKKLRVRREQRNNEDKSNEKDTFECKLKKYKQFLFIINLSNQIYHDLDVQEYKPCLKFYVGPGNNSNLIKSVFKKRFWFVETNNYKEANFVWTQIKIPEIFSMQQSNRRQLKYLQISEQINERKIKSSTTKRILRFDETDSLLKLLNYSSYQYYKKLRTILDHHKNDFKSKIKYLNKQIQIKMSFDGKIHNHLPSNGILGNKKAMFYSLRQFYRLTKRDVFTIVPLTFHIQNGVKDDQFKTFLTHFNEKKKNKKPNIWIIKPGQNTNRGNGIECTNKLEYIKKIIDKKIEVQNEQRTFIIQSYINKPFLYQKRKFDIRTYMLITINNGILKGYWYQQGYVRTSSHYFNLEELTDQMIHLTNDAIQKNGDDYGRFEPGNKLSYYQLQRYLDSCGHKVDFHNDINPIMKKIAAQSIKSTFLFLDKQKKVNNFELFGLDYMIDEKFKPWLIQINTNPCLELSCGVLQRIIPHLIENTFRIGLDPIFAPPNIFPPTKKYNVSENALFYNKFELIFDEIRDGLELIELYNGSKINQLIQNSDENQELYENDGEIIQIPQ